MIENDPPGPTGGSSSAMHSMMSTPRGNIEGSLASSRAQRRLNRMHERQTTQRSKGGLEPKRLSSTSPGYEERVKAEVCLPNGLPLATFHISLPLPPMRLLRPDIKQTILFRMHRS